jgi:Luciferase-like monooxygenase
MPRPGLVLAVEIDGDGAHPSAWRRAAHAPDQLLNPRRVRETAEVAERAGFTLVTLEDDLLAPSAVDGPVGRIGSIERASFIAASTSVLSVAPVVSTTYAEPFHISSQLASLDHISAGRTGWIAGVSADPAAARAWGRPVVHGEAGLRQEAADSVRVVRDLWDSWEDDAVIRDVASSRYLDRDRLHYIDFEGESYSIKGPAIVPRPPQGQLVVFSSHGVVPDDQIDVALVGGSQMSAVRSGLASSKAPRAFVELEVALDAPEGSAAIRVADLERHAPWIDRGRLRYLGDAGGLVALLSELARFADGVRLHPLVLDEDLPVLSRLVVPALILDRIASRPLPGSSLRTTLGLTRPVSRFAPSDETTRGAVR